MRINDEKIEAMNTAKELGYDDEVLVKILLASSEHEIARILKQARIDWNEE